MLVKPIGNGGVDGLLAGDTAAGLTQWGKMNSSNGYGFAVLGASRLGDSRQQGGIYQRRRRRTGTLTVKSRSYAPTNPRTDNQQANRLKFADGMAAWKVLAPSQKMFYDRCANKQGRLGRWLFMSEYMKSH